MKNDINEFPDLGLSFKRMKLMDELEEKVNTDTIHGGAIKMAFNLKVPSMEILKLIKEAMSDNPNSMNEVIPPKLLKEMKEAFNI